MSESARKKRRTTPRNSESRDATDETLHANLRQLSGMVPMPTTPFRRASSAGPTPGSRRTPNISIRTLGTAARTPRGGPGTRPVTTRRAAPTTPHAIRALRERANAARTPGHHRRRSGRIQRETPRDTLRDLSRLLARNTQPVRPSPQVQGPTPRNPALDLLDIDEGPDPVAPRLSMPLDDMYDDDSIHEAPPRQSLLPELPADGDTATIQSLEIGRRALSEDPRMMFTTRLSERFADLNELGVDGEEFEMDGAFINRRADTDADQLLQDAIDEALDNTTTEIQALTGQRVRRTSDVDLGIFGEMDEPDEPTFRFNIPQHIRLPPVREETQEETPAVEGDRDDITPEIVQEGYENEDDAADATPAAAGSEHLQWDSDHDDDDVQAYREEPSAIDRSLQTGSPEHRTAAPLRPGRQRKERHISRHGIEYPEFPTAVLKRLVAGFAKSQGSKPKINKDTLAAIRQATEWYFEQVGEDLAAYAQHGGRKIIEEKDVVTLMKRQRQVTTNTTSFSLAQKMLPRELLQELRMEPVQKLRKPKRKRMDAITEEDEVD